MVSCLENLDRLVGATLDECTPSGSGALDISSAAKAISLFTYFVFNF